MTVPHHLDDVTTIKEGFMLTCCLWGVKRSFYFVHKIQIYVFAKGWEPNVPVSKL